MGVGAQDAVLDEARLGVTVVGSRAGSSRMHAGFALSRRDDGLSKAELDVGPEAGLEMSRDDMRGTG